ncbi:response regulator transcription factor [Roseburia sp. MUC/MUC-530-WT-4D]|uniref:Stage 0 sporulation protein A homolog n=1 Tax=Roseburia porci TaxID=2605790 RepID=A0A6L5YT76_9FIRM|nr:response regulator transcription factor [Roseburia porci]MCI5516858.1 response regulator transcription factor [Roseburia sp.]MDD6742645.1 response regulator transcription factor [Roseburia porci]MST75548.1 response regulator transcription factor [Roseburia porci]
MALIYIVEDDSNIREIETIALKNSGHTVSAFEKARDFYKKTEDMVPDLVLLDVMLPDESGYDIVKKLRKNPVTKQIPIIMVTAKTTEMDMIKGLDDGADDYIKKPFSIMELITRVKALLRRTTPEESKYARIDNVFLDNERHMVYVDDAPVELTFKEYELLRLLMSNPSVVLTREVIMRHVWGTEFEGESRTVDMHIKTLRQKLGAAGSKIKTVRNVGYVME